jgi:hypothetical protein
MELARLSGRSRAFSKHSFELSDKQLQDDTQMTPVSPGLGQGSSYTYYGSPFEAASAGLGGMLRELGYTFGCVPEDAGSTVRNLQSTSFWVLD